MHIWGLLITWLKDKPIDYLKLNGYHTEPQNRDEKRGGGVCFYIKDGIKYKVRDDLAELCWKLETEKPGSKNLV